VYRHRKPHGARGWCGHVPSIRDRRTGVWQSQEQSHDHRTSAASAKRSGGAARRGTCLHRRPQAHGQRVGVRRRASTCLRTPWRSFSVDPRQATRKGRGRTALCVRALLIGPSCHPHRRKPADTMAITRDGGKIKAPPPPPGGRGPPPPRPEHSGGLLAKGTRPALKPLRPAAPRCTRDSGWPRAGWPWCRTGNPWC
jgi:hypothetical protein